jgi:PAS domain S-box-containing protein
MAKGNLALIVEDEYYLARILAQTLECEGIQADTVNDVDSAIAYLQGKKPDIIISDVYMPGKSGLDFFDYCQDHIPDLPFILMTGNPNLEIAVDFLKKGAYDYIIKPFLMEDFFKKVQSVLAKAQKRQNEKYLVNDLKQMLSERLEEIQIYRDIFESTEVGLIILDTEGTIVKVNPGFSSMTGTDGNAFLRQPISNLKENLLPKIDFNEIREQLFEKGQWEKEMQGYRYDGKPWISYSSFFPIKDESGKIFAYSALIKDVTSQREVETALIDSLEKTNLSQKAIIFGMAKLAEYRDRETGFHLERIRSYCKELGQALQKTPGLENEVDDKFIETLFQTAPLHDIGKVGIPDYILLKKGSLNPEEFEIMKSHTSIGYYTLSSIREQYGDMQFLNMGIDIAYCHHERFDGKGYPRGLKGEQIPLAAKIISIADVYDALTTERIYKRAFSHKDSVEMMMKERGRHFDPQIFDVFFLITEKFQQIQNYFSENAAKDSVAI